MARTQYHVVYRKGVRPPWRVEKAGASRPSSVHQKKSAAVRKARRLAKNQKPAELVIHTRNGRIHRKHSYGNDPRRTPG